MLAQDAGPLSPKEHWDTCWNDSWLPRIYDDAVLEEHHRIFSRYLGSRGKDLDLLEVGCGASAWLPYFRKYHGCNVFGVDYSVPGVETAKRNLDLQGMQGEFVLADIFKEERVFDREFGVVASFGFVEHFKRPDVVIRRMSGYLKNGGVLFTQIPNLKGLFGAILRRFRNELFEIHNPMDLEELKQHHMTAGLVPHDTPGYVGGVDVRPIASVILQESWPYLLKAGISTVAHSINPIAYRLARAMKSAAIRQYLAPDIIVVCSKP